MRFRVLTSLALVLTLAFSGLVLSAPAQAATLKVTNTGGIGVCVRSEPRSGATRLQCLPEGTSVSASCWVKGEPVRDYWQGRLITWDRWAKLGTGRYIADIYLNSTATSYPQCGASAPSQPAVSAKEASAVNWAKSKIGATRSNGDTPDGMWAGWCELFVERAYGTSGRYASAKAHYQAAKAAGQIRTTGTPPPGALVFYDWGTYGHVALSIGGGQAIGTFGWNGYEPVQQHGVTSRGLPYLGWAPAPGAWPGR